MWLATLSHRSASCRAFSTPASLMQLPTRSPSRPEQKASPAADRGGPRAPYLAARHRREGCNRRVAAVRVDASGLGPLRRQGNGRAGRGLSAGALADSGRLVGPPAYHPPRHPLSSARGLAVLLAVADRRRGQLGGRVRPARLVRRRRALRQLDVPGCGTWSVVAT